MPIIRVILPFHLSTLAHCEREISLDVVPPELSQPPTIRSLLESLEKTYPMLRGLVREHVTLIRRPKVRFYACEEDMSHLSPETELPAAVLERREPFIILGAISGG